MKASIVAALAVMGSVGCGGGSIQDADGDGQLALVDGGVDCDDSNAEVWTGVAERCDDGIDNNCDGLIDDVGVDSVIWYQDFDGDGFPEMGTAGSTRYVVFDFQEPTVGGECDAWPTAPGADATSVESA